MCSPMQVKWCWGTGMRETSTYFLPVAGNLMILKRTGTNTLWVHSHCSLIMLNRYFCRYLTRKIKNSFSLTVLSITTCILCNLLPLHHQLLHENPPPALPQLSSSVCGHNACYFALFQSLEVLFQAGLHHCSQGGRINQPLHCLGYCRIVMTLQCLFWRGDIAVMCII